ncbi:hypothetical protein EMIT0111MI5_90199 [Burkholderia sp. IT-111MI5]
MGHEAAAPLVVTHGRRLPPTARHATLTDSAAAADPSRIDRTQYDSAGNAGDRFGVPDRPHRRRSAKLVESRTRDAVA